MSIALLLTAPLGCPMALQEERAGRRWLEEDFELTVWDTQRGLPQRSARAIAETPDGVMWIGTFDGLARISSRGVESLRGPVPGADTDNAFVALFVDRAGRLWAGTANDILCLEEGTWRAFSAEHGWTGGTTYWFAQDAAGRVIVSGDGGVFTTDGVHFEPLALPPEFEDSAHPRLAVDAAGNLWVQSQEALAVRRGEAWSLLESSPGRATQLGLAVAQNGGVWTFAPPELLLRDAGGVRARLPLPSGIDSADAVLSEDPSGNLWIGLFDQGLLRRSPDGSWSHAREPEGLVNAHVPALFHDREGATWVGTSGGGAMRLVAPRFRRRHDASPYVDDCVITDLVPAPGGGHYFSTHAGGLYHSEHGRARALLAPGGPKEVLQCLALDSAGDLWIGTEWSGLWRRHAERITSLRAVPLGFGPIRKLLFDENGGLWLAGLRSLGRLEGDEFTTLSLGDSLALDLALDSEGAPWLATTKGAYRISPSGTLERRPEIAGKNAVYSILAVDRDLWFTADGPLLVRLGPQGLHTFTSEDGYALEQGALLFGDEADLWIANRATLVQFSRAPEFGAAVRFGLEDGLSFGQLRPRALRAPDGLAWITSTRGLVEFEPARVVSPRPTARARIHSLHAGASTLAWRAAPLELPRGARELVVQLESSLAPGEAVTRWQYRRLPDGPWNDGDETLAFPDLAPGALAIEARAAYGSEPFGDPVRLDLAVPPFPWERWSVRLLALGATLALLGLLGWRAHRAHLAAAERRAADELQAAEERARAAETLRLVTAAVPAQLVFVTPARRIRWCNRQFEELLAPDSDGRERSWDQVAEPARERLAPFLARALGGEAVQASLELSERRGLDLAFVPQRDRAGAVLGAIGLLIDTSERRALEARLSRSQRLEALGTFAGGIAHDFNNLLAVIMGRTELALLDLEPSHAASEHLTDVMLSSRRARDLVTRILAFGRLGQAAGGTCDATVAAREALLRLQGTLPPGVALRMRLAPTAPARIDTTRLQQIVSNLVSNAALALGDGPGTIAVTVEHERGTGIVLRVADDGCGMSAEVQAHAFEPFFTTRAVGQGTGLGLSVVHGIANECGGSVELDSRPGAGTRVEVRLPEVAQSESVVELAPAGSTRGSRVR